VAVLLNNEEVADVLSPLRQRTDSQNPLVDRWFSIRRVSAEEIVQTMDVKGADAYSLLQNAFASEMKLSSMPS
jgi:hypothetical protein